MSCTAGQHLPDSGALTHTTGCWDWTGVVKENPRTRRFIVPCRQGLHWWVCTVNCKSATHDGHPIPCDTRLSGTQANTHLNEVQLPSAPYHVSEVKHRLG